MTSRRFAIPAALTFVAMLALPVQGDTQAPRRAQSSPQSHPATPLQAAMRMFNQGRYDDVDTLTDKLDKADPNVVALKARAAIARGKYIEAEAMLRPVASRMATSDAALELGLLQQMLSKSGGDALLERVAANDMSSDPAALARAARALRALGRWQLAKAAYRDAAAAAPTDVAINTAWGELFLEGHNNAEALKSFQAALEVDATYVPAVLGSARALADEDPPQAVKIAQYALEVNPSSVDALVFLASQAIDEGHQDEARQSLQKALAVNPSSLDAHALTAALSYIQGDDAEYQAEVAKTLAISPRYGEVYRATGELASHRYWYDDAVTLARRATDLEPRSAKALADLGIHLLRTGDEPAARVALEKSFEIDPYSVVTFNLLGLLDSLDKFETVRDGNVILRMSKAEAPVMQEYAMRIAHQALQAMSAKYEFTPRGPILIEIFPKHDDFAVRNAGLPGMIGALGACFGRVVTMDSPKARPPGEFQWEATLWHELTHVVTLQMSNQRVPRWLTEGISEYEEKQARPEWGRGMEVQFAGMLARGEALKLTDLNGGFTNPKTISLAYFEATLLVEHLFGAYGDAGMRKLLRTYATGVDPDTAMRTALNTDFDQLQAGFDQFLERKFGSLRLALAGVENKEFEQMPLAALRAYAGKHTGSYQVQMALGRKLREAGENDEAINAFERAAALVPLASGQGSPNAQIAEIALKKKDRTRVIAALTAVMASDFNSVDAPRQLAGLLREAGIEDPAKTGPVYQRIVAIDPFDAEAHAALGRLAIGRNDFDMASREFRAVLALGPVDRAAAHTDLAESYFKGGKRPEAKKQTLAALEIAPTYERAQDLLLKLAAAAER